jgi:hypothetical protein
MKETRYFVLLILIILTVSLLAGCSNSSDYDKGYAAGYHGNEKGLFYSFASQDYKSGYEHGAYDSNVITVYENCNRNLGEAASYLGISVYDLKELLRRFGYNVD